MTYAPRSLVTVIDRMLPVLERAKVDTSGLRSIQRSAGFTAPELIAMRWEEAEKWLTKNAPPTTKYYGLLLDIWAGAR